MPLFVPESASQMRRSSNHGCQISQLWLSLPGLQTEGEPFVARDPGFNLCSKYNFNANHLEWNLRGKDSQDSQDGWDIAALNEREFLVRGSGQAVQTGWLPLLWARFWRLRDPVERICFKPTCFFSYGQYYWYHPIHIYPYHIILYILVGGFKPPWKIWVRQIGSSSQLLGKIKFYSSCSKPPTSIYIYIYYNIY